jgi:hypothetical protein
LRFNSDDFTARDVDKLSRWTALIASQGNPMSILTEDTMKQSQNFLENADNCGQLAERAADEPTYNRYKRMEAASRALAVEQDWLNGEIDQNARVSEASESVG